MIIDIGGGTTEIAVIALNGIVCDTSIRVGGDELDEAIVSYVKKNHNLLIGDQTAENIKKTIGSAHKFGEEREMEVKGLYQVSGVPKTLKISSLEIREALQEPIQQICDALKHSLEQTPPELAADIKDRGIVLTGGGALLQGPARAAAGADRPAHQPHGRPAVLRGAGHRQDPRRLRALPARDHEGRAVLIPMPTRSPNLPLDRGTLTLGICVVLAVTLLALPRDARVLVADRLGTVLTAPYWSVRNFGEDVARVHEQNAWLLQRVARAGAGGRRRRAIAAGRPAPGGPGAGPGLRRRAACPAGWSCASGDASPP